MQLGHSLHKLRFGGPIDHSKSNQRSMNRSVGPPMFLRIPPEP